MATMAQEETFKYLKLRRVVQTISLILINPFFVVPFLNNSLKRACVPVMNCWSCPAAAFACPIGSMGYHLAAGLIPYMTIGIMILVGVLIGRMLCGWICPFGFMQDLLYKIRLKKIELPRVFRYGKYVVLIVFVFIAGAFLKNTSHKLYFCSWCPAGTLEAAVPVKIYEDCGGDIAKNPKDAKKDSGNLEYRGTGTIMDLGTVAVLTKDDEGLGEKLLVYLKSIKVWILVITIVGSIMISRFFCRIICPIGAMFALFNKFSFFDLKKAGRGSCTGCSACYGKCTVDPVILPAEDSPECTRCLDCVTTPCEKDYEITINRDWCKKCGVCTAFCPAEVYTEDELKTVTIEHPEKCTGCGWCTKLCPDFAITVKVKEENEASQETTTDKPEAAKA